MGEPEEERVRERVGELVKERVRVYKKLQRQNVPQYITFFPEHSNVAGNSFNSLQLVVNILLLRSNAI